MSNQRTVALSPYVYTSAAIAQTISDFHQLCTVTTTKHEHYTRLEITVAEQGAPDIDVISEFLNYLLGLSAQELLC